MKKFFAILLAFALAIAMLAMPAVAESGPKAGKTKTVVTLSQKGTVTLSVGETYQLTATVTPAAAVVWTSKKPGVATVDNNGKITAVKEGTATIIAKAGGKSAKVKVKVVDLNKPTGIKISQGKSTTLKMGDTLQLGTTLTPESAKATLTWKSSKTKVATVDASGKVTPVAEGKTKITVTTQNKKKATVAVTVVDPNKPAGLTLSQGTAATISEGETLQLVVGLVPATAKATLTWKSNKPKIATVDSNGVVTAVGKGKVTITVQASNNKKAKAVIKLTVSEAKPGPTPANDKDLYPYLGKPLKNVIDRFSFEYVREKDDKDGHYFVSSTKEGEVFITSRGNNFEASIIDEITIIAKNTDYNFCGIIQGMRHEQAQAIMKKEGWTSLGEVGEELYAYTKDGAYLDYQAFVGHEVECPTLARHRGDW